MDKKIGLSVAIVVLVLLSLVGYFGYTRIQTDKVTSFIEQQEKILGKDGQDKQDGLVGTTHVSAFYVKNGAGQRMPAVEQAVLEQVDSRVKKAAPSKKIDQLLFVQSQSTAASFPAAYQITIKEESYRIKGLTIKKQSAKQISEFLVTDTGERFYLPALFTDFEAIKPSLLEQVTAQLTAAGASAEVQTALASLDWKAVSFDYDNGQLVLTLPESISSTTVQIPMSSLYDTIQRSYLPEAEVAAYDAYQAQKALQNKKLVALTFDDGPSDVNTPRVLDLLQKYKVKATFYVLGRNIPGNEALLKRMEAEGHEVGNHTTNHQNLPTLSAEQVQQEVGQTQDAIQAVLGHPAKAMRPPYGAVNAAVSAAMNMPAIHWTVDTEDWKTHNPAAILQQVQSYTHAGSIVLMHDIHSETADSLESILQYLTAEGYTFVTISEMLGNNLDPHSIYYSQQSSAPIE